MQRTSDRYVLPGARSRDWLARRASSVPRAIGSHLPAAIVRAEGAVLTDEDGHEFIDLTGGLGCLNVGYSHPDVVRAIQEQAARFTHTDFAVSPYSVYVRLAERLTHLAPGPSPKKVAFFSSGAEAIENAVKVARAATGRPAILAFEGAFHGRTYMAMTLTSKVLPYKKDFGPFVPEVYRVSYPNPYRWETGPARCAQEALDAIEQAFVTTVQADRVAAIVVEPVLGEGGFVVPPPEFLPGLRDLCDRHGIALVVDEVQTGVGRTGRFFAAEHAGIEPDLLTLGKSIAAGMPLSALIGKASLFDLLPENSLGGTSVGNPVCCAAALAVLDVIERQRLVERALIIGQRLRERFLSWQARYPLVGDVRGLGAMMAIELVKDRTSKAPAPEDTRRIIEGAMTRGVLLARAGVYDNVIRILTPLVIAEAQLDYALDRIEEALREVSGGAVSDRDTSGRDVFVAAH
jgi:4-aminobutyrate aminotransferase/(S)-3-amino-2-methylpropionate transaminase